MQQVLDITGALNKEDDSEATGSRTGASSEVADLDRLAIMQEDDLAGCPGSYALPFQTTEHRKDDFIHLWRIISCF